MPFSLKALRGMATETALLEDPAFQVIGVRRSEGGDGYAEVMFMVDGCDHDPCRLVAGVDRTAPEPAIRLRIAEALRQHVFTHAKAS